MTCRRVPSARASLAGVVLAVATVAVGIVVPGPVAVVGAGQADAGATVDGFIVTYAPGVTAAAADAVLAQVASTSEHVEAGDLEAADPIGFGLSSVESDEPIPVADAAELAAALEASPLVVSAEPDIPVSSFDVQVDPPWNLDRIDQRAPTIDRRYRYQHTGAGVRVYIVDSGVRGDHQQFGGRVVAGFSTTVTGGDGRTDPHGHGTHVAGTVAGSTYGVAKQATVVPVQVLDSSGSGTASAVITGLDWIVATHPAGAPGVVNLSFGADLDYFPEGSGEAIDTAVRAVIAAGLTVVIAAGNGDTWTRQPKDACTFTPARVADAITVAASRTTGYSDLPASFTNFGTCVDIFAPGVSVVSAGRASTTATANLSGTSMAAPHVAGVAAQLLQASPSLSPAEVWEAIAEQATVAAVSEQPGDPDLMVHTGGASAPTAPTSMSAAGADAAVNVSWAAPADDGGAAVQSYTAQAFTVASGGSAVASCSTDGAGRSCTIAGLTNGSTYFVEVVASNTVGTSPAASPRVSARPGIPTIGTPTISGTARFGSTLTARPGTWGPSPVAISYAWLRDGTPIDGATAATYLLGADDVGRRISVAVTGSKVGFGSATRTSTATVPVAALALTRAPTPMIRGTARFGSTLTVTVGTWSPSPVTTTIAWKRNGVTIPGATASSYVLGNDDIGARITVMVTGSRPGYLTTSRTSWQTSTVTGLTFRTAPTPRITGSPVVGSTLTAQPGTWAPGTPTLTYTWLRNGRTISGASGPSYVVAPTDRGARISVRVTATQFGYTPTSRTSWSTASVTVATRVARDGSWLVGSQLATDTYITAVATWSCTWVRRSAEGAPPGALIADDRGSGQRIVTVEPDDAVLQTSGCGRWYRLADIAPAPRTTIPSGGVYSVAHHIVPGTYRASTRGGTSCYWARLSGFGGSDADVVEQAATTAARPVVVIDASTVGFEASRACGSWTRIG